MNRSAIGIRAIFGGALLAASVLIGMAFAQGDPVYGGTLTIA